MTPKASAAIWGMKRKGRSIARVAALAMTVERVRRLAFRTVSQIGIRYRSSPLSETAAGLPDGAPRAA